MKKSETIGELAKALSTAQGAFPVITKDMTARVTSKRTGQSFEYDYVDLAAIVKATKQALAANNIAVVQSAEVFDSHFQVTTLLLHSSGEWVESDGPPMPLFEQPQEMGSAWSYARRYGVIAAVFVAPAEEDDDAQAAQTQTEAAAPAPAPVAEQRPRERAQSTTQIDAKRKAYFANADKLGVEGEDAKNFAKDFAEVEHFNDLTVDQLRAAFAALRDLTNGKEAA